MRYTKTLLTTALLLVGTARTVAASDDLTVISKLTHNGKPAGTETNYMSSEHVRMGRGEGTSTIVDLKSGTMTTLDDKKKTYYLVTKQDLEQMQAKMQEKMNDPKMKQAMAAMQSMGGATSSFTPQVAKTGVTRKIAGFNCEEWAITMSPMMTTKECVTTDLKYPVRAFEGYKEFAKGMQSMMSGFGPIAKSGAELAEKLKSMKGFPVATSSAVDVMSMKQTTESEVVEVRHSEIPASVWEIPAGYTKIENPMMKAFQRHPG